MGCWNKTCGLTQLPILAGEPVWVFPIESTPGHERCYSHALWTPLLFPLQADYNDYGGGENTHHDVAYHYLMDVLAEFMVELEQGDNEYHDIPVQRENLSIDLFYEAVHEGRLSVTSPLAHYGPKENLVDFTMIRKDVVEQILSSRIHREYVPARDVMDTEENNPEGYDPYVNFQYSELVALIPELATRLTDQKSDDPKHMMGMINLVRTTARDQAKATGNPLWYVLSGYFFEHSRLGRLDSRLDTLLNSMVGAGATEPLEAFLERFVLGEYINGYMTEIRGVWKPGCHEGSQSAEWEEYVEHAKLIQSIAQKKIQEWEEW